MKTQLLKITSLVMMVIATIVVYAYDNNDVSDYDLISCPDGTVWNPNIQMCDSPENVVDAPSVIGKKNGTGEIKIFCYEEKGSICALSDSFEIIHIYGSCNNRDL